MKLAITSSQTILQKGMCKQQLHHHLQMYALLFLHLFLTLLPYTNICIDINGPLNAEAQNKVPPLLPSWHHPWLNFIFV